MSELPPEMHRHALIDLIERGCIEPTPEQLEALGRLGIANNEEVAELKELYEGWHGVA